MTMKDDLTFNVCTFKEASKYDDVLQSYVKANTNYKVQVWYKGEFFVLEPVGTSEEYLCLTIYKSMVDRTDVLTLPIDSIVSALFSYLMVRHMALDVGSDVMEIEVEHEQ